MTESFYDFDSDGEVEADNSVGIITTAIVDGSQVLQHDGYDVQVFHDACALYPKLGELVQTSRANLITAPALIRDVFWSFYKRLPTREPIVPVTAAHQLHEPVLTQMMSMPEWHNIRSAGTLGDIFNSAVATLGAVANALAALDAETIARINHLHELESGADTLFAQAEALETLAAQATGDGAEALFDQAEAARKAAVQAQEEAEATAATLIEDAEQIEDGIRRNIRAGIQQADAQILDTEAAIKTFGGGYGPGTALQNGVVTTKDKIAIAQHVQQSQRLKQIAAITGRLTRIALKVQETKIDHPPDEVTNITFGSDLARLLPSELALLAEPALEEMFFERLIENKLMQYELVGHEKQGQGPIIVAIDESGSMGGQPDTWAKAVMLAFMAIARLQDRDIAFIHFSNYQQIRVDRFPKGRGPYIDVMFAVDHFFGGGTVFEPWMREAMQLVQESAFTKADVIVISDGMPNSVDQAVWAEWQTYRQQREMRAYGVLIGTEQGAEALASITDALLTLSNLADDVPLLQTIFAV